MSSKIFLHDCTAVHPVAVLLFASSAAGTDTDADTDTDSTFESSVNTEQLVHRELDQNQDVSEEGDLGALGHENLDAVGKDAEQVSSCYSSRPPHLVISKSRTKVLIGGWIRFRIDELHSVLLRRLQTAITRLLRDKVSQLQRSSFRHSMGTMGTARSSNEAVEWQRAQGLVVRVLETVLHESIEE